MKPHERHIEPYMRKRSLDYRNGVEDTRTMLLNELHRRVGLCFHCGKATCAGKNSGSNLPRAINTNTLIEALDAVVAERKKVGTSGDNRRVK